MKRAYFVVEGPHDIEVVGRFLGLRKLSRQRDFDALDRYWHDLVPRTFPIDGDLLRRVPVPVFFAGDELSVAVESAGGRNKIGKMVQSRWLAFDDPPEGLGVILDADDKSPSDQWLAVRAELTSIVADIGEGPGKLGAGNPRAGIYVLPNNSSTGTLEDLLLTCASHAYPRLLASARSWIDGLDPADDTIFVNEKEREYFGKPAGKSKAIAGCIASILRPGKSIQVSIQDNMWFRDASALAATDIASLGQFIDAILA